MFSTQEKYHARMKLEHRSFKKFMKGLNSVLAQQSYGYHIQKFMRFCVKENKITHEEAFEELLEFDSDKITDVLDDFVESLEEVNYKNVSTALTAPELFFTMNRKIWHNKLVRKGITRLDRIKGGSLPIKDDEIEEVYKNCKTPRDKFIISLLGSTGIRPGAIVDPILKFKHLTPIKDCYGLMVYDESSQWYWSILIPETSRDLERYKQNRIRNGEKITDESPLLATETSRWNPTYDYITLRTLTATLERRIKGHMTRVKKEGEKDYDKAITYMFRKRFNTKLKLNNEVNSNVAELCMGHKLPGSQSAYTRPTLEEVHKAVKPAFESLTINSNVRKDIALEKVTKELEKVTGEMEERLFNRLNKGVTRPEL